MYKLLLEFFLLIILPESIYFSATFLSFFSCYLQNVVLWNENLSTDMYMLVYSYQEIL